MSLVQKLVDFFSGTRPEVRNHAQARAVALEQQRILLAREARRRHNHVLLLAHDIQSAAPSDYDAHLELEKTARFDRYSNGTLEQAGFSLIELLIAVAILGILSAVALFNYRNYPEKASASEATNFASGMQAGMVDFYNTTGAFPATLVQSGFASQAGKYVTSTNVSNGEILVTFGNALPVPADLQGTIVAWTPYVIPGGSIAFTCGYAGPAAVNWAIAPGANASSVDTTAPSTALSATCRAGG